MLNGFRKWLVNKAIAPLAYKVMPADGWDGNLIILNTGYFWVVSVQKQSTLANEQPNWFKVVALQLSHDKLVQKWELDMPDRFSVDSFLAKLGKTQGVNNVCVLGNAADFSAVWGALDKEPIL